MDKQKNGMKREKKALIPKKSTVTGLLKIEEKNLERYAVASRNYDKTLKRIALLQEILRRKLYQK